MEAPGLREILSRVVWLRMTYSAGLRVMSWRTEALAISRVGTASTQRGWPLMTRKMSKAAITLITLVINPLWLKGNQGTAKYSGGFARSDAD